MLKLLQSALQSPPTKRLISNSRTYAIIASQLEKDHLKVQLSSSSKNILSFPYVYLQDNCPCPSCFHDSSQSRLRKLTDLKLDSKIINAKITGDSTQLQCTWDDGHQSTYTEEWFNARRFTKDNIKFRTTTPRDNPTLVASNVEFPTDTYDNVMSRDDSMLNMLQELCKKGIFLLKNAGYTVGELKKLTDAIGFIRITHYGHDFTVKSEPNAVNLAYTSARLGIHTDLPYYVYPPGVQMLHCIKQFESPEGDPSGESHLVDGFLVAEQMKVKIPKHYETLCTVPVEFYDVGVDYIEFFKYHQSPTFVRREGTQNLTRVVYSNQVLSSYMPVDYEQVQPVYEALKVFTDLCYKPENLIRFKLKEREVLLFDNWRMLHGREGFDPNLGERHLEGVYIDFDEVFSRINVIKKKLGKMGK